MNQKETKYQCENETYAHQKKFKERDRNIYQLHTKTTKIHNINNIIRGQVTKTKVLYFSDVV